MQVIEYSTVDVGDELGPLRVTLSSDAVRRYALAAHMPGGRFASDAEAQREGLPGQIVPGNLSIALFARLIGECLPGVQLKKLSATFRALIRPRQELLIRGVVIERHTTSSGDLLECDLVIENSDSDRLVTGTATISLPAASARVLP